jgi:membrane protease YdiL (CAAX protease family)
VAPTTISLFRQQKHGRPFTPRGVRRPRREAGFVLVYALLYLGYLFLNPESEFAHWLTLVLLPLLGLWFIRSRKHSWRSFRATLGSVGLVPSRLRDGVGTALVVGLLLQVLPLLGRPQREAVGELVTSGRILYLLPLALVFLMLTVAFTEEFFFRGVLQTRLAARWGSWLWAVLITSVLFSLYHVPYAYLNEHWPSAGNLGHALGLAFINGLPGGLILGWLYVRGRGNLLAPMLTHAMIDLIPAMMLLQRVTWSSAEAAG